VQAAQPVQKSGMPKWIIILIIVGALAAVSIPFFAIIAAILIPNFLHARAESAAAADEGNLKQIATAIEAYAVDHGGKYPDNLPQLTPRYVKALPSVPGGDGTGAYDYHHPASRPAHGAYEIWDDGSMDPTTIGNLPGVDGKQRYGADCKYVVYTQKLGIICMPGLQ
jgi:competence protein ComGC